MKKLSKFEKERWQFSLMQLGALFLPLLAITLAYAIGLRIIFGENYYVSIVLAGILGGLWSLAMAKGYELFVGNLNKTEENWYSKSSYAFVLQKFRKIAYRGFFVFLLEVFLIWIFKF